jgi:hypothetical protein
MSSPVRWATSRLLMLRVTILYGVILICVNATIVALGPVMQYRLFQYASTNLHNLSRGHVGTLIGSAFVVDAGPIAEWLPGLLCLLGLVELFWGSLRLVVAFAVGHVGATVLVAAGLAGAVSWGWTSAVVTQAEDVGMSYGAMAALGAMTPAIPRRWRAEWIGWWLAVGVAVTAMDRDFTDVGHVVALILGMLVAIRFGVPRQWTPGLVALFFVGSFFGLMVITGMVLPFVVVAPACGAVAVLTVEAVRLGGSSRGRQRNSSADASTQSESQDSGGPSRSSPGMSHS